MQVPKKYIICSLLQAGMLLTHTAHAQDNQYETIQLGAKNSVLSGASTSRRIDGTAAFSNPATLAQNNNSSITLNTAAWSLTNIRFKGGNNPNVQVTNNDLRNIPSMLGGDIQLANPRLKLGYAVYHHVLDHLRFSERASGKENIISDAESPGQEAFTASYHINTDITEIAASIGSGYRLSNEFCVGLSAEFLFRTQTYQQGFTAFVTPHAPLTSQYNLVSAARDIDLYFDKVMTHLKLGFAFKQDRWNLGATITTPTFGLYSYSEFRGDVNLDNFQALPGSTAPRKTYVANAFVVGGHAQYKYPWSMSAGASRRFGKVQAALAGSYYGKLSRYTVVDANNTAAFLPVEGSTPLQSTGFFQAWSVNKAVLNWSASADYMVKPSFHWLFSARSDKHYGEDAPQAPGFQLAQKLWDIYHITAGVLFKFNSSEIIAGIQYSTGSSTQYQLPYSAQNITEQNYLLGIPGYGKMRMNTFSLLLSYSLVFIKKQP